MENPSAGTQANSNDPRVSEPWIPQREIRKSKENTGSRSNIIQIYPYTVQDLLKLKSTCYPIPGGPWS
ncbi:hypothetical protein M7I_5031 [Glarea lozoyensis 74030]|uniref:Uncharacterized protein n=1 Tax=Glarea lozoyensis (strain ATCC 74030 / MF5533) TaxID=1104152 RepID=H0EQS6_GLAL7|nr:hypothetical protein M7I_5031 [Glarea lozoyensis 74030]